MAVVEQIRRITRGLIPMSAYRKMAIVYNYLVLLQRGELALLKAYANKSSEQLYKVYVKAVEKEVWVRGDSPDLECVVQNLIREEYGSARESAASSLIIDAGGYIGDTALFFHTHFPNTPLVVLEPEPRNFEVCQQNLRGHESIHLIQAGLGAVSGKMSTEGDFWSAKVNQEDIPSATTVPVITIDEVVNKYQANSIDVLKMDIEGAETEVLNDRSAAWPAKTSMILVETHGKESEDAMVAFAQHYGFSVRKYRSIHILINQGK